MAPFVNDTVRERHHFGDGMVSGWREKLHIPGEVPTQEGLRRRSSPLFPTNGLESLSPHSIPFKSRFGYILGVARSSGFPAL